MENRTKTITVSQFIKGESGPLWENVKKATKCLIDSGIGDFALPGLIQHMMMHADHMGYRFVYPDGSDFGHPLVDNIWGNVTLKKPDANNERYFRTMRGHSVCKYPERDCLLALYFILRKKFPKKAFEIEAEAIQEGKKNS